MLIAKCHNHLGDVYNALSDYALAKEHYDQARHLLEARKGEMTKDMFDSYLELANIYYPQAKFDEALSFYKKCATPTVASINRKAFWQGRIAIGQIKLTRGDYHGAKTDFSTILEEIVLIQDIDVVTLSMAYSSMINCMTTIGQYQVAIDSCDAAINKVKMLSSPKNTYIADLLIQKGNANINIGKIKEGERCMNEAIEIYKSILGENHPSYANACVKFADYYILVGELKKAEEMSEKALSLMNSKFGKNHLTTVGAHFSKNQLYQTYAEFNKAQAELDTIRTIYKNAGLLNDYCSIQIRSCEARMKVVQGETAKAIPIFQEAINCVTKTLGTDVQALIGHIHNNPQIETMKQTIRDKIEELERE